MMCLYNLFPVYFETGHLINAGTLNINIGAGAATQIRTWKVSCYFLLLIENAQVAKQRC